MWKCESVTPQNQWELIASHKCQVVCNTCRWHTDFSVNDYYNLGEIQPLICNLNIWRCREEQRVEEFTPCIRTAAVYLLSLRPCKHLCHLAFYFTALQPVFVGTCCTHLLSFITYLLMIAAFMSIYTLTTSAFILAYVMSRSLQCISRMCSSFVYLAVCIIYLCSRGPSLHLTLSRFLTTHLLFTHLCLALWTCWCTVTGVWLWGDALPIVQKWKVKSLELMQQIVGVLSESLYGFTHCTCPVSLYKLWQTSSRTWKELCKHRQRKKERKKSIL